MILSVKFLLAMGCKYYLPSKTCSFGYCSPLPIILPLVETLSFEVKRANLFGKEVVKEKSEILSGYPNVKLNQ